MTEALLVKLQVLPVQGSERVRDGDCDRMFLATFQEITINDSEESCDGVCF